MIYLTSDWHLGQSISKMREIPCAFGTPDELEVALIEGCQTIPEQDILYHVGDVIDFRYTTDIDIALSLLAVPKKIPCKCVLLIGNNEERLMRVAFKNDFYKFSRYCRQQGWADVSFRKVLAREKVYIAHKPSRIPPNFMGVHGHLHICGPVTKAGYNVSCNLNGYKPVTMKQVQEVWESARKNFFGSELNLMMSIEEMKTCRKLT